MRDPILIIDDSPTVRKIVQVALQRDGYHGISFSDGLAALRWLLEPSSQVPGLIFLDIGLPKLDGYGVARYIKCKPRWASVPIIMLTRRDGTVDRLKARLSGACGYVTKPFTTQTITTLAQHYIGTPVC